MNFKAKFNYKYWQNKQLSNIHQTIKDRSNYCVSLKMQPIKFRLDLPDMRFEFTVPTITANSIYKVSLNG